MTKSIKSRTNYTRLCEEFLSNAAPADDAIKNGLWGSRNDVSPGTQEGDMLLDNVGKHAGFLFSMVGLAFKKLAWAGAGFVLSADTVKFRIDRITERQADLRAADLMRFFNAELIGHLLPENLKTQEAADYMLSRKHNDLAAFILKVK